MAMTSVQNPFASATQCLTPWKSARRFSSSWTAGPPFVYRCSLKNNREYSRNASIFGRTRFDVDRGLAKIGDPPNTARSSTERFAAIGSLSNINFTLFPFGSGGGVRTVESCVVFAIRKTSEEHVLPRVESRLRERPSLATKGRDRFFGAMSERPLCCVYRDGLRWAFYTFRGWIFHAVCP